MMTPTATTREIADRLRDRVVAILHLGQLEGGGRLPSIRQVAGELGVDQRKVARAYRILEAEGLVEVRGRSGVFIAPQARLVGGMLEETAEWLGGVLLEAWKRRIGVPGFPDVVRQLTSAAPIRCVFVDDCEDAITAFSHEMRQDFGLAVTEVWLDALRRIEIIGSGDEIHVPRAVREADLIATTVFCASAVREALGRLQKPIIVVTLHPQAAATVIRRLRENTLSVVCADPSFGERIRLQYADYIRSEDQLRVVRADDRRAVQALTPSEPVLLTRAARKRIGDLPLTLLMPHSPTLSPDSAKEIIRLLIRINSRRE